MSDDLYQKLLATFRTEAGEHLERIRHHVETLQGKKDPRGHVLDEAFRRAHSLKGAARAVTLAPVETLAHRLETLFSRVREGTLGLDATVIKTIYGVLEAIEDWLTCYQEGKTLPDPAEALRAIDHFLMNAAPASSPAPEKAEATLQDMSPDKTPISAEETVRINTNRLDHLRSFSGEFLAEGMRQKGVSQQIRHMGSAIATLEKTWQDVRRSARLHVATNDRASQSLESLDVQMRELRRQIRSAQQTQHQTAWIFKRLGDQLSDEVGHLLRVPAESVFHGFRKMVRDLARDEGKDIEFRVAGLETEADRAVLQALKDPVMHLLRNAINHGIEKRGERSNAGKSAAALILLRLESVGNRLRLSVEDDGRGLNLKAIAQAAVRKGILSPERAEQAGPEELTALVFHAGFSTAPMVTDLSGRGMGLSVVREEVLRLQGDMILRPREGGGTLFELSVPLMTASHRLLLVRIKEQTFAIPVHAIDRLLRLKTTDIAELKGNPVIKVADEPVSLFPLSYLLKMKDTSLHVDGHWIPVVVLKDSSRRLALAVDGFVSEQESVIVNFRSRLAGLRALTGGIVMADGSVVSVLNAAELLRLGWEEGSGPLLTVKKKSPTRKTTQVLVVDDSITTRTLEKSILEAHGYRVNLAVDGVDALEKLRQETADLVIVDVQMPRMDGFTFVEEMKKQPALSKIPIIMVTSLEEKKDKERGLEVGVDAYIVKGKFDHLNLLETIRQIL